MNRRGLLLGAGGVVVAGLAGFQLTRKIAMSEQHSIPPWHLWGTAQTLVLHADATVTPPTPQSQQMVRVNYHRPESWRFLVSAEIQRAVVAVSGGINVSWSLQTGVGRSQIIIPDWIVMKFPLIGAAADIRRCWTTVATLPPLDPATPDTTPRLSDILPGQDIQLNANFTLFAAGAIDVTMRLDAYFAPNVHVRPDWFEDHRR